MTRHSPRPAGHGLGGVGRSAVYIAGASLAVAYGLGGCTSSPLADGGTADAGPVESGRLDAGPPCMGAGEPRLFVVTALFEPPPSVFEPLFISADGAVVAGSIELTDGSTEAFRWTAAKGLVRLGFANNHNTSKAVGLSADGAVVVGTGRRMGSYPQQAFRWTETSGVAVLWGDPSSATAVNADGSVVVGAGSSIFRWTETTGSVALDPPTGATSTAVTGLSADGATIIGSSGDPSQGLRWTETGWSTLGPEGARPSLVNADGSVVVGRVSINPATSSTVFRWTARSGLQSLDVSPDRPVSLATGISSDGSVIVGYSRKPVITLEVVAEGLAFRWTDDAGLKVLDRLPHPSALYRANRPALISADGSTVIGFDLAMSAAPAGYNVTETKLVTWDQQGAPQEIGFCLGAPDGGQVDIRPNWEEPVAFSADGAVAAGRGELLGTESGAGRLVGWVARLR